MSGGKPLAVRTEGGAFVRRAQFLDHQDGLGASQFPYLQPVAPAPQSEKLSIGAEPRPGFSGSHSREAADFGTADHAMDMDDSLQVHTGVSLQGAIEIEAKTASRRTVPFLGDPQIG